MIGSNIKLLRNQKKISQEELGKVLGVTTSAVGQYETGVRNPSYSVLNKLADYFGVTVDYLLGRKDFYSKDIRHEEYDEAVVYLPVISEITNDNSVINSNNIERYEPIDKAILGNSYDYFFLKVKDDSMNLLMNEGNLVLVQRQSVLNNGAIAVIMVNGQNAAIKRYYRKNNAILLLPLSTNLKYHPELYDEKDSEIQIIGKAVKVFSNNDLIISSV